MKLQHFITAGFVLLLTGCGGNIDLDNPSVAVVNFTIDGTKYEVAPGATQTISLGGGSHTVQLADRAGNIFIDTTISVKEGGVLHSGSSTYVVWKVLFGDQSKRGTVLNEEWTEIDSVQYKGDFEVFGRNDIYLEKNWDLGLSEALPTSKTLYATSDYKITSKVFRYSDFDNTYTAFSRDSATAQ